MIKLEVIGDPIEHSKSPIVHGAVLSALGIEFEYKKTKVPRGCLVDYIEYAKKNGVSGFNLTMPHKTDIIPYLSEIDDSGLFFESVNTVCIKNGKLCGYNTDGVGYELSLKRSGHSFKNSRVVIHGAGGAARTIALLAAKEGAQTIYIINRTNRRAEELCKLVSDKTGVNIDCGEYSNKEINQRCSQADIMINATPLGMSGCTMDYLNFDFLDVIPKTAFVSDLIYNPETTKLLEEAKKRRLKTQNGYSMLIYQAIVADEHYLGHKLDVEFVYDRVYNELKEKIRIQNG